MKIDNYGAWVLRTAERISAALTWENIKLFFSRPGPM